MRTESRLRILVVSQYFWPEGFRVNELVADLVGNGNEVTVLTAFPNYPEGQVYPDFLADRTRYAHYAGAAIIRVPFIPRGRGPVQLLLNYISFALSAATLGSWRLRGREFDSIFVFGVSPITVALPAIWLRRLKRAPLLFWILDLWPETLSAVGAVKSPRMLSLVGRLVSFIYKRSDRILVQSRSFIANIEKYSGEKTRVRYFPGWAEAIFMGGPVEPDPAPEMAPFRDTINILFAGNIGESQDFPAILDAAEILADRPMVRWLVIGDGRALDWVRSEILRRGLGERVFLLGRHPIERMPSFFQAADALLVSLKAEPVFSMTIPGKVQSYLASGIPLLGMLDGEGARVIEAAGAGLTCPAGQGPQLADLVRRFTDLPPAERKAMGDRGRAYCRIHFDRGRLIKTLEAWMAEAACREGKLRQPIPNHY